MAISPLQEEKVTMTLDAGVKVTIVGVESEDTNIIPIVYGNVAVAGTDDRIEIYYVDRILTNKHYASFLDSGGNQMFSSQQDALNWFSTNFFSDAPVPPGGVTSFNGRTGAVLPQSGDYSLSQITGGDNAILQGGNSFGTSMSIGTNDGNFLHFRINSTNIWGISGNGSIFNSESSNYLSIYRGSATTSGKILRNTNNSYSVFAFDNANASSTGNILDFQNQGNTRSYIGNDGSLTFGNTASVNGITLYNTADQTTNYSKLSIKNQGSYYLVGVEQGGSASSLPLILQGGGGRQFVITTPVLEGGYQMKFTTGGSNLSGLGVNLNYSNSSGINNHVALFGTINQSGSAGYRGVYESIYEQALGSGPHLLMDLGTNTAANGSGTHTSKFSVDNTGVISISNVMKLATVTNSSPQDGDLWREDNINTGLKIRVNGVTKTITLS
jgi:hypothetical protein